MAADVSVRRATAGELPLIQRLVHDEYVRSGLIRPQPDRCYRLYPHLDGIPETIPLVAIECGEVVGTLTATLDGPNGLPTDIDYPEETAAERLQGRPLASCWRLATRWDCHTHYGVHLALMFQMVQLMLGLGEPTVLQEIHPRHVSYYWRRFGFEAVAQRDQTQGLADKPSVLVVGREGTYSRIVKVARK